MTPELYGAIGLLIGSVMTVLIAKVFEYFTAKRQHDYFMKQEYFQRKISIMEKATEQSVVMLSAIGSLCVLFRSMVKESNYYSKSTTDSMILSITKQIDMVNSAAMSPGNSVFLYTIPLGGKIVDIDKLSKMMDVMGELGSVMLGLEMLNAGITYDDGNELSIESKSRIAEFNEKLSGLANSLDELREDFEKQVEKYRKELDKYNSNNSIGKKKARVNNSNEKK